MKINRMNYNNDIVGYKTSNAAFIFVPRTKLMCQSKTYILSTNPRNIFKYLLLIFC